MTIVFFNPYADPDVKGAARRIEFLRHLLDLQQVPNRAILATDYALAPKGLAERLALRLRLRRLAYFLHAWRLCRQPGTTVISEVIFTPTWHENMVLTVHDLKAYDARAARGGKARRWAYGLFTRLAQRIVVVSESVCDDMQRLCGVAPERIHVVPNGISRERLALAAAAMGQPPRHDFIYVSSFARHKRHAMLLRAAPAGSRLCLIGRDLGSLDEVRAEAGRRAGEIQVDIMENVDTDAQLFEWLGSARCGVFPSVFEGFGIPLLEYGAAGLYVVASDIPPFRELAAHVDCFVPPDDERGLHDALTAALARPVGALPEAARKVALSPYTETAIAQRLARLLRIDVALPSALN
jgi:glycosyltransferase involved in cell wall biosynthesis